jgi:LAGLIDADG DNA endonuclease family
MDDGSLKSKDSKGVLFNTQSFTLKEVEKLCSILKNKYNLNCWQRAQHDTPGKITYQIYVSGSSYEQLRALIYHFIIPSMRYKFPLERRKPSNIYISVYNSDGSFFKIFNSKAETMRAMNVSSEPLNRALLNGKVYRGFIYKLTPKS